MALRDNLLHVVDLGNKLSAKFGLSRFSVTIRRRVWSGNQPGQGTASNVDIVLTPPPRVRDAFSTGQLSPQEMEYLAANNNVVQGHLYRIDKITPQYTNTDGTQGGYSVEQVRMWPNRDARHIEEVVCLVGDDGYLRECMQVSFEQDRAFGYSMLVKEQDRPRTPVQSLAVTPSPAAVGVAAKLQLIATATFVGGATSLVTPLVQWSSSNAAVATVDLFGVVTGVGAGTATITATWLNVSSATSLTVS